MKQIDLNFYPGWVRKAITFTIDDGNIGLDEKFLRITKPAKLKGTFNLCTPLREDVDYKAFYAGYEIADHCYRHVYAQNETRPMRPVKNEPFDRATADKTCLYPTGEKDLYHIYTYNWTYLAATTEKYLDCARKAKGELEEIFGKGAIRSYVWPCGYQENKEVNKAMKKEGFQAMRITGCVKDSTGFALPSDRQQWSYNADYTCLAEVAAAYEAYPDDGKLKFFCFGVHSHDFEIHDCWNLLVDFCEKYGNRPEDFWYATNCQIFDYEDAVKSVIVTEEKIQNHSPIDLYIKVEGKKQILPAGGEIKF